MADVNRLGGRRTRRSFIGLAAGSAAAIGVAACAPSAPSEGVAPGAGTGPVMGGQVTYRLAAEPTTMMPTQGGGPAFLLHLFSANSLTRFKYPEMDMIPDLSDPWTVSADGLTYTFPLKKNVKFHDGTPMTAKDVKFTYEYFGTAGFPGGLRPGLIPIVGMTEFNKKTATEIAGLKVLDDYRVEFKLTNPDNGFLADGARLNILPQHVLKDVPPADILKSPFARKPILTGPYMLDSWKPNESLSFKLHPGFHGTRGRLDSVLVRIMPDESTAIAELRTGGIDFMNPSPDRFEDLKSDPNFNATTYTGSSAHVIRMNHKNPMFADKRVREAFARSIDQKTLVNGLLRGRAEEAFTFVAPTAWTFNPNVPKFTFDLERARQLLTSAGWNPGWDPLESTCRHASLSIL